jgi:hypothetical protein
MRRERAISNAERRHDACPHGEDDARDLELPGDGQRMQRPGAAERHHAAGAVVEAVLAGVDAERAGHVLVDDVVDTPGGTQDFQAERLGHAVLDGILGCRPIERHGAAQEEAGIEKAQHQVGVGQRRPGTAAGVAGGARIGPGAARADAQQAAVVDVGDAAPAGPDLDHVDGWDADGEAAALPELVHARYFHAVALDGAAAAHQRALGRGTTHIEGQQVR